MLEKMEGEEIIRKTASIEENKDPYIKLQGSEVGHLSTHKGIKVLILPLSPLPIIPKAA
jgi:hypothetical protein